MKLPAPVASLVAALQQHLSPDLLDPYWTKKAETPGCDPTTGHCVAAASAFWYLAGGTDAGWRMRVLTSAEWPEGLPDGESHYFVVHAPTGLIVDPTASQFKKTPPYAKARGGAPPTRGRDDAGRALPPVKGRELANRVINTKAGQRAAAEAQDWAYENLNEGATAMTAIPVVRAAVKYIEMPSFVLIDDLPPNIYRQLLSVMGDVASDIHDDAIAFPYNKATTALQLLQTMGVKVERQRRPHAMVVANQPTNPGAALDAFINEYRSETWENPIDPHQRGMTIKDKGVEGYVLLELRKFEGAIHISSIMSTEPKKGFASFVLKQLCEMADKHGVVMTLDPKRFGTRKGDLNNAQLRQWYSRHDFAPSRKYSGMARMPKGVSEAAHHGVITAAEKHRGVMIALYPPEHICEALALEGGEDPTNIHITIAYLGKLDELPEDVVAKASDCVQRACAGQSVFRGSISGVGRFAAGEQDVVHATIDIPGLSEFRVKLCAELEAAGIPAKKNHGFDPHATLKYVDVGDEMPLDRIEPVELSLDTVWVVSGDTERHPIKVGKAEAFTVPQRRSMERAREKKELRTILDNARDGHVGQDNIEKVKDKTGLDPSKQKDREQLKKSLVVSPPSGATAGMDRRISDKLGWW